MYSEEVMELFENPKNMGEIEDADGVGKAGNPTCGDVMKLYINVSEEKGSTKIEEIKFKTFGCAAAIATSSKITEIAEGKTIEEALETKNKEVADELGGLPKIKMHCSVLAADALKEAIYNYKKEKGEDVSEKLEKFHEQNQKKVEEVEHTREEMDL